MAKIKFLLKLVITFLFIALILKFVGFNELFDSFKTIRSGGFIAAFALAPVFLFFKIVKWQKLVKEEIPDISFLKSTASFLAGWGVALLTPARIGELARILYFDSGNKIRLASFVLFDKLFDFVCLIILALMSMAFFFGIKTLVIYSVLAILLFFLLFNQILVIWWIKKLVLFFSSKNKFMEVLEHWHPIPNKTMGVCFVYSMLAFIITLFQCFLLINSFESVSFAVVFLVFPIVIMSNILPFTIGGLGVREGVAAILLHLFGVSKASAVNATFMLFFVNTIIPGLIGTFFVSQLRIRNKLEK